MLNPAELLPLLPELVLVGAAFALLMLDLFLDERQRWITHVVEHRRAGRRRRMVGFGTGGQGTVLNGMFIRDIAADVMKFFTCLVSALSLVYIVAVPARARPVQGRSAGAGAVRHRRHDADGVRGQPGDGVPRPGNAGAVPVRAGRDRPRQPARLRSGDEVLRPGVARLGHAAVRHVADLRRDRLAGSAQRPRSDGFGIARPVVDRHGVHRRGHRVQVRCRAIPHVAAGRLPRRADADHVVHRFGAEDRRIRHGLPPAGTRHRPARRANGAC